MDNEAKLRPLYLAKILYERTDETHYLTTAQLIQILEEEYGISAHRQTIKAEIELLQKFGLEIEEVKSTQNRYNLFGRTFDAPELTLLIDAVESSKFITTRKSQELVEKISTLASNFVAANLKRNVSCEGRIKPGNERVYIIVDAINEAINANKKIAFKYFRYNAKKEKELRHNGEEYIVTPLHLVWNGDCYYMVGLHNQKDELVIFRIDRIASTPQILEEDGKEAPADFNIDDYVNTTFHMYNSKHIEVQLVCDNDLMDAIIDRFGEDVTVLENDAETFKIAVNVAVSHVFYSWVFGFGGKVKIVAPEDVKSGYAEMVKRAVEGIE